MIEDGSFSGDTPPFYHEETVTFSCNANHTLVGDETLTCNDGNWTASIPSCEGNYNSDACTVHKDVYTGLHTYMACNFCSNTSHISYYILKLRAFEELLFSGGIYSVTFYHAELKKRLEKSSQIIFVYLSQNCIPSLLELTQYNTPLFTTSLQLSRIHSFSPITSRQQ